MHCKFHKYCMNMSSDLSEIRDVLYAAVRADGKERYKEAIRLYTESIQKIQLLLRMTGMNVYNIEELAS